MPSYWGLEGNSRVRIVLAVLVAIFVFSEAAQAANSKRDQILAQREVSCKAQARKQHPGVKFLKRREYVNRCMGRIILHKDGGPKKPRPVQERLM